MRQVGQLPRIIYYHVHKRQPSFPVHVLMLCIIKIHFIVILKCMPLSPALSLLSSLPKHNFVRIYYFPYPVHLSLLSMLPLTSHIFMCCHLYEISMSLPCDFAFCRLKYVKFQHMNSCCSFAT